MYTSTRDTCRYTSGHVISLRQSILESSNQAQLPGWHSNMSVYQHKEKIMNGLRVSDLETIAKKC